MSFLKLRCVMSDKSVLHVRRMMCQPSSCMYTPALPSIAQSFLIANLPVKRFPHLLSTVNSLFYLIFLSSNLYLCKCYGDNTAGGVYDSINVPTRELVGGEATSCRRLLFSCKLEGEQPWMSCTHAHPNLLLAKVTKGPYFTSNYAGWKQLLG